MTAMAARTPADYPASLPLGLPSGGGSRALSPVARYVGTALLFIGLAGFAPLAVLWLYPDEASLAPCFIFPSLAAMALGYLLRFASSLPGRALPLSRRQAAVCTLLIWALAVVAYAAPFVAAGLLTPVQALFEATSGLTTTGLSVVDVATCPAMFLFHRSLICYLGGVGLVLVLTCVVTRTGGLGVYNAEGHTDRLLPSSAKTARLILLIYTGLIAVGAVAYVVAGLDSPPILRASPSGRVPPSSLSPSSSC